MTIRMTEEPAGVITYPHDSVVEPRQCVFVSFLCYWQPSDGPRRLITLEVVEVERIYRWPN
jgi:hypothetical protein